ncbi:hypothetical protein MD484_g7489, partial [Candolleomyces efflorescens]
MGYVVGLRYVHAAAEKRVPAQRELDLVPSNTRLGEMDIGVLISSTRNKIISRHIHNVVVTAWIDIPQLADWLHTLPFEVEVIWPARWNVVKFLYFFNRYFPLDIIFSYIYIEVPNVKMCRISYSISSVGLILSLGMSEAVIFIRLYALSRQSAFFRWWLIVQFIAVQGTMFALLGPFLSSFRWVPSPAPRHVACLPVAAKTIYATISFAILMANEALIVLIMLYIGGMRHRYTQSSLIKIFYRDGLVFFLFLAASSVVNITMLASLPVRSSHILQCFTAPEKSLRQPSNRTLFAVPQRVIHSMLASRMILHLRQESYFQEHGHSFDERYSLGDAQFAHKSMSFRARRPSTTEQDDTFFALQDMSSKR